MTFTRSFIFVLSLLLLEGCAFSNKKQEALILEQGALLEEQRVKQEEQSSQLTTMQAAHENMLTQMQEMSNQLALLSAQLQEQSEAAKAPIETSTRAAPQPSAYRADKTEVPANIDKKAILGRVEYLWLDSAKIYVKARVDTGASASSLDAANIERFERNGERWVRFSLKHNELNIPMEAPLVRFVRIRQASLQNELDRRPVVKLKVRLGELVEETEFTLTNRNAMIYPVLLGRSFLQDIAIVDVAKKFTRKRSPAPTQEVNKQ